jgi:hypothetical protein
MTDTGSTTTSAAAQDTKPGSSEPTATELALQNIARHPWLYSAGLLAKLAILAAAGAAARLLITPDAPATAAIWIALTAAAAAQWYRKTRPRPANGKAPTATGWQPGEPPPTGIPAATIEAATRIMAQISSRRWRGSRLEIARCDDPVRHGRCREAGTEPLAGGMLKVILGEHIADRPADVAFVLAHETRHPTGWTCHLSVAATSARLCGWLVAGWAVPWPWLLAALAAIQAVYAAACWVTETGCDLGGARAEGRTAALGFFAHRQAERREPKPGPAWGRYARYLLITAAVPTAHPPLWLRAAIIRACIPARQNRAFAS